MFCRECTARLKAFEEAKVCEGCRLFGLGFSTGLIAGELKEFVKASLTRGGVALELSGGRHSAMALGLLRLRLGLNVVAVTLSNGYIPSRVIRQARELAARLGARHVVVEAALEEGLGRPAGELSMARSCTACNRHLSSALLQIAKELRLSTSANGENKYRTLVPQVTAMGWIGEEGGHRIATINLPFAMRVTRREGEVLLREIGWQETGVPGMSSNCLVPWLSAEAKELERPGNPLVEMIAAEVRSGYLTRDEGFEALRKISTASDAQVRAVRRRVERWSRERYTPRVAYDSASSH